MNRVILTVFLSALGAGCVVHRTRVVRVEPERPPVAVVRLHDAESGDAWDGGRWIACPGHHHHEGCGHFFHHGFWHVYRDGYEYDCAGHGPAGVVEVTHVHNDHCGHCWDGERWILVTGHVHGPGCGHYWHHGAWHLHPETYDYGRAGGAHFGVRVVVRRR